MTLYDFSIVVIKMENAFPSFPDLVFYDYVSQTSSTYHRLIELITQSLPFLA
jgi:hypothetical protein